MNKIITIFLLGLYISFTSTSALAVGPGHYVSKIKKLQATSIGNDYNTVHLELDVTNSPCTSTVKDDRFTITSNVQHSTILAALMAGKIITIFSTGICNDAGIESISDVRISP